MVNINISSQLVLLHGMYCRLTCGTLSSVENPAVPPQHMGARLPAGCAIVPREYSNEERV